MPYKRKKDYNQYMSQYMRDYRRNIKNILNDLRSQGMIDTRLRKTQHRKRRKK